MDFGFKYLKKEKTTIKQSRFWFKYFNFERKNDRKNYDYSYVITQFKRRKIPKMKCLIGIR